MLIPSLQTVNHTQHLRRIPSRACWIAHDQPNRLLGVDDEDTPDRKSNPLLVHIGGVLVVKHIVEVGDLTGLVTDNGKAEAGAGDFVNVFDPTAMALNGVGGETDELSTALSEFRLEFSKGTEFCVGILSGSSISASSSVRVHSRTCRAYRGVVLGMAEQHYPFVANELVEVDRTIGRFGLKIGSSASEAESVETLANAARRRRAQ